ncbi:hypothetical protein D3C76_1240630 [compost metagenome]
MFSRKSVRSTKSLRERQEDSSSCTSLACRMTSICLLSFLSSSTIMLSTSALLTGSEVVPLSRMLAIRAATPCLATLYPSSTGVMRACAMISSSKDEEAALAPA